MLQPASSPRDNAKNHHVDNPTEAESMITAEGLEAFRGVLELCGFVYSSENENCPRLRLMESVRALGNLLSQSPWQEDMNEDSKDCLLEIEASLDSVRRQSEAYLEELELEHAEIADMSRQLEDHDPSGLWIVSCREVQSAYTVQNQREEQEVRLLLRDLSKIYSADYGCGIRVDSFLACLQRKGLLQRNDFLEFLSVFNKDDRASDNTSILNAPDSLFLSSERSSKDGIAHVDTSIVTAKSVWDAVARFRSSLEKDRFEAATVTTLLVVGSEGSGKTHLCNDIGSLLEDRCIVIRPSLPLDLLGKSVGEAEDTIVSMFSVLRAARHACLLLDGLEHIISGYDSHGEEPGLVRSSSIRCSSTLLALLDATKRAVPEGSNLFVVCTSTRESDGLCARFDRVFRLEPPNSLQRRALLESIFLPDGTSAAIRPSGEEDLLGDLVEATIGRSYAELNQYCRQALENLAHQEKDRTVSIWPTTQALLSLKARLQTVTPESLKSGILADSVDMRILTARDLRGSQNSSDAYSFPMKGASAAKAWTELENTIIVPLCRSKELRALLCESDVVEETRAVTGGILLEGESGCGKSEVAMQCACYASSLLPTLKTLDVSCTSLIHKEIGGSERAIGRLFDSARKAAPCILILDGIENIAAVRGNDPTTEGTLDRVLSTLLTEIDGIDTVGQSTGGIAVIGITCNAKWIDPALKRPGRLEKTIRLERD